MSKKNNQKDFNNNKRDNKNNQQKDNQNQQIYPITFKARGMRVTS